MDDAEIRESTFKVGKITVVQRLTRAQFLPLIILPALSGTFIAYREYHLFNALHFVFVLLGVVLLHLGANAIDDCYDFQNNVDKIANSMFPKDFGGWKPIPRGLISLGAAKRVSYSLFLGSLLLAIYFLFVVGPWSLILGALGIILAITYTVPPIKLDYRGLGLGEIAIFFAFGPIQVLGSFYVQTGILTVTAFLASVPIGIMTVTVLIYHDLIFYEVYSASKKMSLGAVLGRARSLTASLALTAIAYSIVFVLVGVKILPLWSCLAPLASAIVLARKSGVFKKPNEPPPYYVPITVNGMISNWIFSAVLALSILL
ncbi:MAG: prenyltransferase [Nitrososphaerota archaeon]|nr:prenyltransferase [Nitrososphaerota archaeon]